MPYTTTAFYCEDFIMYKSLIKSIFSRSLFLKKSVFKLERWLRDDMYSNMSHERFTHFLELLTSESNGDLQFTRMGSQNDGGYVFCDLGRKYSTLISFGVGDNVDFEFEMSELVDSINLYDPTVDSLPRYIENATFHKIGLGPVVSDGFITLQGATGDSVPDNKLLLKVDIEGGEWDSLVATDAELLKSFTQIFLELHDLHKVYDPLILSKYIHVLEKLRKNHDLVNIHANNWSAYSVVQGVPLPDTIEITLLKKEEHRNLRKSFGAKGSFNNAPNNPEKPDYRLIF